MKSETYKALLKDLQKLEKTVVTSQIEAVRSDPTTTDRMARLHAEAEVGGGLDDFVATAARKSTVLFLLRTVFVRVLEDLGILGLKRIRDDWGFAAFREVAPALGFRAYFAFVFRDLARDFPALFSPGEEELPLPNEDGCRALWNLWHHPNRDGEHYVWNGDGFDSRFLGDLYQDLDADIRKRYALLQTPHFVEVYILDHAVTPALAEFDPAKLRAAGETFRVLDPACGSGHFLIGAFHRLADYWRDFHGLTEWEASERALESVWGCDINPHAVEIASFRLLLEVVARTRVTDMDRLARLAMNLRTMDSLIPWERTTKQEELFPFKDRLDAYATPKQRRENAAFLQRPFHVVVGNPPYITPKDVRKKTDYKLFWPDSCYMRYALSAPFAERILSIGAADAFTGQITANSFLKRQFGVPVIEKVLPRFDVTHIVDTSGAFIPGHGTPTLIIFARNRPPTQPTIKAILGKRGEPRKPANPEKGLVWSAIAAAGDEPDDSSPFISVTSLSRESMASHPWSLGGGAAGEIHEALESAVSARLVPNVASRLGLMTILKQDDLYFDPPPGLIEDGKFAVRIVEGVCVRDFYIAAPDPALFPYKSDAPTEAFDLPFESPLLHFFWKYRGLLWARMRAGR